MVVEVVLVLVEVLPREEGGPLLFHPRVIVTVDVGTE